MSDTLLEIVVDVNGKQIPVTTREDVIWLRGIVDTLIEQTPLSKTERISIGAKQAWTEKRKQLQGERMKAYWEKRRNP